MSQKIYCYVDETGQDTQGALFIVSVVVTDTERDRITRLCEAIERSSGKKRVKWTKTHYTRQVAYIEQILQEPAFQGRLYFAIYRDSTDYVALTTKTIAAATLDHVAGPYKATILIDGLPRSLRRKVGSQLRHLGIRTRKVRGLKDENDALIRLADAVCGLVRAALIKDQVELKQAFEQGKRSGYLKELEAK